MQTLGEFRIDVRHNPSGNPLVDEIKRKGAALIDLLNDQIAIPVRNHSSAESDLAHFMQVSEIGRLKALAMTQIEHGVMDAIKAVTKPLPIREETAQASPKITAGALTSGDMVWASKQATPIAHGAVIAEGRIVANRIGGLYRSNGGWFAIEVGNRAIREYDGAGKLGFTHFPLNGYAFEEHQIRVWKEWADLTERLDKLRAFQKTEAFALLSIAEQEDLTAQGNVMTSYLVILKSRIVRFTRTTEEVKLDLDVLAKGLDAGVADHD
ncbi:hypothetical protein [Paracoccus sp. MKU1]|uniref:Acb2/Tad1 domain-containing protein n=1 Tax=Paracoccus sp. MKU1 TaxID=1745182 RepID=UPI00071930FB|nr:hypothetical protein [Paracoccus sp. MKU1]KRW94294.1 hypothetical protein AQY21_20405 [Paracoccus sp. MKU1]